ncbi:MAG: tetratricopeptide repeat protein [Halioglobus sp.]
MPHFFRQLGSEIRRRKVFPVLVSYAVAAWLVLQIAEVTFEPLGFPESAMRLLIVVAFAGIPAVVFLAWLIDFRKQGLIFDLPLWWGAVEPTRQPRARDLLLAVGLAIFVCLLSYVWVVFLIDRFPAAQIESAEPPTVELPPNSIAVLAFDNFDGNKESDYFASGLAEEILDLLAGIDGLNVAARTSSFRFRGENVDIREIAELLSVRHVLEGSVRRDGDRIRITAQLIDGQHGYHDWSKTYDRNLSDIFAIQQEIAAAVVNELKIAMSIDFDVQVPAPLTENIDAYIFYLQGRQRLHRSRDPDVIRTARQLFTQAIGIDPNFARAYAGICDADLQTYEISNDTGDFQQAMEACNSAEQLSAGASAEVSLSLAMLDRYQGAYAQAKERLDALISNSPTNPDAYIELGEVLFDQNELKAAESAFKRAADLKRNYWKAHEALASFYYRTERYAEAARAYEIVTSLTPDIATNFAGKGAAYWMLGDNEATQKAYENSLAIKPSRQAYTNLGLFYYNQGRYIEAANMQRQALEYAPDDHRVWGRLAESLRHVPDSEAKSRLAFERAAELAEKNLLVNPEDWYTRGYLGFYLIHLDEVDRSTDALKLATAESQRNPDIIYLQALVSLELGDVDATLEALEEIVEKEPTFIHFIVSDPDFQRLATEPRFQRLLP